MQAFTLSSIEIQLKQLLNSVLVGYEKLYLRPRFVLYSQAFGSVR